MLTDRYVRTLVLVKHTIFALGMLANIGKVVYHSHRVMYTCEKYDNAEYTFDTYDKGNDR